MILTFFRLLFQLFNVIAFSLYYFLVWARLEHQRDLTFRIIPIWMRSPFPSVSPNWTIIDLKIWVNERGVVRGLVDFSTILRSSIFCLKLRLTIRESNVSRMWIRRFPSSWKSRFLNNQQIFTHRYFFGMVERRTAGMPFLHDNSYTFNATSIFSRVFWTLYYSWTHLKSIFSWVSTRRKREKVVKLWVSVKCFCASLLLLHNLSAFFHLKID